MDPVTIATTAATILTPYLIKAGQSLADKAVEKLPEGVGKLWGMIQTKFTGKPAAEAVVQELVQQPENPDNQEAFTLQLKKLLKEDPEFANELAGLVTSLSESGRVVNLGNGAVATGGSTAAGAGGIAVGGNVGGSIILGSSNTITTGGGT